MAKYRDCLQRKGSAELNNLFLFHSPGFLTGFERVPILGVDTIMMTVEDTQIDTHLTYDWYYPKAHTCNSTLELPIYSTKEIMRDKLTETLSKKRNTHN